MTTSLPHIQVWGPVPTRNLTMLDGRYKYIYWYYQDDQQNLAPTEELYDLEKDPYEMTNIVSDNSHADTLNNMRNLFDKQIKHWHQ